MDSIDKKLLILLQKDSKKTTKELSVKLNLSVTAVYERIKKLEREGIIQNYVALINRSKVNKGFVVFCHIKLIQHTREFLTKFAEIIELCKSYERKSHSTVMIARVCWTRKGKYHIPTLKAIIASQSWIEFEIRAI